MCKVHSNGSVNSSIVMVADVATGFPGVNVGFLSVFKLVNWLRKTFWKMPSKI